MRDKKLLGKLGEDMARAVLYAEGYNVLEQNYRSHTGEIDVICEKDDVIWFVEVKTRTARKFGEPNEAVDMEKKRRIRRTAECYMKRQSRRKNASFKVIEIMVRETNDDFMFM